MICTLGLQKLPFEQYDYQVIYTEGTYSKPVNEFLTRNYNWVKKVFKKEYYDFCYIPLLERELLKSPYADYFAPSQDKKIESPNLGNDFILEFMIHPERKDKIKPMILFHTENTEVEYPGAECQYQGYILDLPDDLESNNTFSRNRILKKVFSKAAHDISNFISNHQVFYRRGGDKAEEGLYDADSEFDRDSWYLIEEIRERILKLHQMGISDEILHRAIFGADKLSKLVVTTDKQILLPDYNIEIKLRPLPRAVYLLFLRHREGIMFKSLPDYRNELAGLYREFRGGELSDKERQSVIDVTNPLNNSINEKCARIREAFLSRFDNRLAQMYCIEGRKGEPKRISLPDNLIEWQ